MPESSVTIIGIRNVEDDAIPSQKVCTAIDPLDILRTLPPGTLDTLSCHAAKGPLASAWEALNALSKDRPRMFIAKLLAVIESAYSTSQIGNTQAPALHCPNPLNPLSFALQ